jgi:acetate---CoA ligase (ADP-forming)
MDKFFNPTSIAIIGASRNPDKVGHVILNNLLKANFPGKLYPINPSADALKNIKCYPSVLDVKNKIDLAIIVVPASIALKAVEDCGKKNIKHMIMVTAGFSETGNHDLENKLLVLLNKYKIQLLGPNVLGVFNTHSNLDTLFLPSSRIHRPQKGYISFICQSGAVGSATVDLFSSQGFKFSKFVSYGNALNVNETDLIEYLGNDSKTKVICLYIEGVRNGKKFIEVCKKVSKKKPIIMIKGGLTTTAARATLSHTASLAGSGKVYEGALKQANIIQASTLSEMFNFAKLLSKNKKPKGRKVQVITNGMGYAVLSMDYIELNNLEASTLSKKTLDTLKKKLPPLVNVDNPLDLIGDADNKRYKLALEACVKDSNVDIILLITLFQTPLIDERLTEMISKIYKSSKKPIAIVATGSKFTQDNIKQLEKKGIPCFSFPDEAVAAIRALCEYHLN